MKKVLALLNFLLSLNFFATCFVTPRADANDGNSKPNSIHQVGNSKDRESAAKSGKSNDWLYADCSVWDPATEKVVPMGMSMSVWEKSSRLFKERIISAQLTRDALKPKKLELSFNLEHQFDRKKFPNVWTEPLRNAQKDGERFDEDSVLYEERQSEKLLVLPLEPITRPKETSFQKFSVAMFSNQGNYLQAQVTAVGKEFNSVRITGVCGNGFGFSKQVVGKMVPLPNELKTPPAELWPIDSQRPTVVPVGREYSENQMVLIQNLLERLGASQ